MDVRFGDIDMLGHVNNAKYVTYIEYARMKFSAAILPDINWKVEGFILARNEVDYILPIYLEDKVYVDCWCSHIGSKSFSLEYDIKVERDGKEILASKAKTVLVAYHYKNEKSMLIPEDWKGKLERYSDN